MPEKDPRSHPAPYSPLHIINYKEKGWMNLGNARMVFFDVKQGFFQIRRLIEKEVGENSSFAIFQAGIRGGYSFLVPMLKRGRICADAQGFLLGLSNYAEAGFGNFELIDLKWDEGFAIIHCRNAIEGWAYVENRQTQEKTVCDYTRGIFIAFMKATHKFAGTGIEDRLDCIETSCIGKGDPFCEYMIAEKEVLKTQGLDLSRPRMSIRKQLKKMVRKKTGEITKSLKCIEQLKEYNENIIESITNGIMALDRSFNILTWNRGMEHMLGVPAARVLGKNLRQVSRDSIQNEFFEKCRQVMETGLPLEEKGFKLKTLTKGTVTLNFKILPLFNERKEVTGVTVFHEDISEKEKIELKYRNLFEKARDGIFVTDLEGNFISVNEAAQNI
ncbi:MAG TPA: PAS domain S-box protein, partial [bacterium]|nr:PAS domain S-box protein [bacterium]